MEKLRLSFGKDKHKNSSDFVPTLRDSEPETTSKYRDDTEPLIPKTSRDEGQNTHSLPGASLRTVECPTCQGKGYLTQGQAESMVALIPIRDSRLKPKRTKLYLCLTFFFCLVTFSLVAFFLMPRSVTIELYSAESINISISSNTSLTPYIIIATRVRLSNGNFYKVHVSNIQTQVTWNGAVLNTSSSVKGISISSKQTELKNITLKTLFVGEQAKKVRRVCADGWNWKLTEEFLVTAQVSNLGREEQVSISKLFLIVCYDYTKSGQYLRGLEKQDNHRSRAALDLSSAGQSTGNLRGTNLL